MQVIVGEDFTFGITFEVNIVQNCFLCLVTGKSISTLKMDVKRQGCAPKCDN